MYKHTHTSIPSKHERGTQHTRIGTRGEERGRRVTAFACGPSLQGARSPLVAAQSQRAAQHSDWHSAHCCAPPPHLFETGVEDNRGLLRRTTSDRIERENYHIQSDGNLDGPCFRQIGDAKKSCTNRIFRQEIREAEPVRHPPPSHVTSQVMRLFIDLGGSTPAAWIDRPIKTRGGGPCMQLCLEHRGAQLRRTRAVKKTLQSLRRNFCLVKPPARPTCELWQNRVASARIPSTQSLHKTPGRTKVGFVL